MNKIAGIGVIAGLVLVVAVVIVLKPPVQDPPRNPSEQAVTATHSPPTETGPTSRRFPDESPRTLTSNPTSTSKPSKLLPRLVDLGRGTCIPCKQMMPILADLKKTYQGRLDVEVIDLREHPEAAQQYGIRLIPTQIFFDPSGKELFRHEGSISKQDILGKWKALGIDLASAGK
jgi:thioredoxin 1